MNQLLSARTATYGIISILSLIVVFHLLVLSGIIPYGIVWGGRLQSREQMLQFETVSILLNLLMLAVVALKAGILKVNVTPGLVRIALWLMTALFALNTVGNLFSNNELEKLIFTPLTLLLAVFCFRLAISKEKKLESEVAGKQ